MFDMLLLNPKNRDIIDAISHEDCSADPEAIKPFYSIGVTMSDLIPERLTRDQWHPPQGDRFCEYGPEDEEWMRPLGLGNVEKIDIGPLIMAMQMNALRMIERQMLELPEPSPLFSAREFFCQTASSMPICNPRAMVAYSC